MCRLLLAVLLPLAVACDRSVKNDATPAPAASLTEIPAPLKPRVTAAKSAAKALGKKLSGRLTEAMGQGGPEAAIDVCAREAQTLTAAVAKEQKVELGRTSHKLRNPKNAPRNWVRPWLDAHANAPAEKAQAAVYNLGTRLGVLIPIPTGPVCTVCHGTSVAPDILAKIRAKYPKDQATGFDVGDLRGAFWIELER